MPASLHALTARAGTTLLLAGGLLASRPAAAQWVQQNSNLPDLYTVNSISIADANTVWASATDFSSNNPMGTNPNNRYIRTTNGGTTWVTGTIPDAANYAIESMSAANSRVAWAAVDNLTGTSNLGRLYYTSDGGNTWTRQLASAFGGQAGFINGVLAFSATQAAAVGDPNTAATFEAYYTTDAGTTWQAATTPTRLSTAEYGLVNTVTTVPGTTANARSCWMGTNAGRVLRSTDSGVTWQAATTGLTQVTALAFCSTTTGLAVYSNTSSSGVTTVALAYTTDGGATWTARTPTGPFYPSTISGVPGLARAFVSAGFANGGTTTGSSYSTDGGATWIAFDAIPHYSVAFLNGTTGYSGGFAMASGTTTTGGMFKGTLPASVLATTAARQLPGLSVYPNPATDRFTVAVPAVAEATRVQATLYNALGESVAHQEAALPAGGTQLSFPATGLAAGLYTLRVQAGDATASQQVSVR